MAARSAQLPKMTILTSEPLLMTHLSYFAGLLLLAASLSAQVRVTALRCEHLLNPQGIETSAPRLSWQLLSDQRNTRQTAWELRVAGTPTDLLKGKNLVWNSGRQASDASVHVPYAGPGLSPGRRYHWQVRVWDASGKPSEWSEPAYWQMGLPGMANLGAQWIGPGYQEEKTAQPSPYLRKTFALQKKVRTATAYITALGMYEAWINGQRIGDACLTPGWTAYQKRVQYQTYDVTSLLTTGNNTIGAILGNGWYRGFIGFSGQNNFYGKEAGLLLRLDIEYTDGSTAQVLSDGSWSSATGSIRSSEVYNGETIDGRLEPTGWSTPAFNASAWKPVSLLKGPFPSLVSTWNEPVKKHEAFKPIQVITTPKGEKSSTSAKTSSAGYDSQSRVTETTPSESPMQKCSTMQATSTPTTCAPPNSRTTSSSPAVAWRPSSRISPSRASAISKWKATQVRLGPTTSKPSPSIPTCGPPAASPPRTR